MKKEVFVRIRLVGCHSLLSGSYGRPNPHEHQKKEKGRNVLLAKAAYFVFVCLRFVAM